MDKFIIEISPASARDLDKLEMGIVMKVFSDIKILEENPFQEEN